MNFSTVVLLIGGVVGLVGGIAGILSWLNQREQTTVLQGQLEVMQEQFRTSTHQEGTAIAWAQKFDEAAEALMRTSPNRITTSPGSTTSAYKYIFKNEDLQRRIETYLGHRQILTNKFVPEILTKEQLQNPVVQHTIQDVLDAVAEFKRDHNDFARTLKLL